MYLNDAVTMQIATTLSERSTRLYAPKEIIVILQRQRLIPVRVSFRIWWNDLSYKPPFHGVLDRIVTVYDFASVLKSAFHISQEVSMVSLPVIKVLNNDANLTYDIIRFPVLLTTFFWCYDVIKGNLYNSADNSS